MTSMQLNQKIIVACFRKLLLAYIYRKQAWMEAWIEKHEKRHRLKSTEITITVYLSINFTEICMSKIENAMISSMWHDDDA